MKKVPDALNFAIKFYSPKFTYFIFENLYEWTCARDLLLAIEEYSQDGWKMLDEIRKEVAIILHKNVCE